jgi:hypothetical protein
MFFWHNLLTVLVQIAKKNGIKKNPVPGGYKYGDLALQVGGVS